MNTHDIKLPPLPEDLIAPMMLGNEVRSLLRRYGERCVSAAIEADRKRRGAPVAWQRLLQAAEEMAHASHVLAGTDERNRLLAAIEAVKAPQSAKTVRGEPVAWMYEYEDGQKVLTTHLDTIQQSSKAWTPLYAAPQPAEPVKVPSDDERAAQGLPPYNPRLPTDEEMKRLTENGRKAWGKDDTEPVRVPNEDGGET